MRGSANYGRARMWASRLEYSTLRHPAVGELHLHPHRFIIPHSGGQQPVIYRADPGSDSAKALEKLRAVAEALPRGSTTLSEPALG